MIKGIYYKNQLELNQIQNKLLSLNINIWNIHKNNDKNLLTYFYNEDFNNINIGFDILKEVV